jgi:aspartyl-tRNA(Asn)/glutamyl-tRNA(Gln) amidotransferase subunit A
MPLSHSLDVVGPIARTVADVALLTAVIAGPDADDPTSLASPAGLVPAVPPPLPNGLRVAIPTSFFTDDLDPECADALAAAAEALRRLGCALVELPMPALAAATDLYPVILGAEAASLHGKWLRERPADYAPQVRGRLLAGLGIPAHDYVTALRARAGLLARLKTEVFARADVILAPVWSRLPPRIADVEAEDVGQAAATVAGVLRATLPANVLGLPALSVPAGMSSVGVPLGVQLIGRPWSEPLLLSLGHAFEASRPPRALPFPPEHEWPVRASD